MEKIFSRDEFANEADAEFSVFFDGDAPTSVRLVEVSELRRDPRRESFSLVLLAPPDAPVLQQMFRLEHPRLGPLELSLVPVGATEDGIQYEAVFNRLID